MDRGWVLHAVSVALVLGVLPVHLGVVTASWSRLQLRRGGEVLPSIQQSGGKDACIYGFCGCGAHVCWPFDLRPGLLLTTFGADIDR